MDWSHLIPEALARRYRVVSELGRGAMGVVLQVERVEDGRRFAMKLLLDRDSGEDLRRFQREGRVLSDITHPHIVGVEEVTDHAIVMELIDGQSLADLLADGHRWDEAEALTVFRQLLGGLEAVHAFGIVHRDVKPENIFIRSDGTAALGDFGIARVESDGTALTATGMALGTPNYMSPEQMEGATVDGRADLFSLGLVVGELMGAGRPWEGESLFSIIALQRRERWLVRHRLPNVSDEIWRVLEGLTHIDADRRFESARRVLDALDGKAPEPEEGREAAGRSQSVPDGSSRSSVPGSTVLRGHNLDSSGSEGRSLDRRLLTIGILAAILISSGVILLWSSPFDGFERQVPSTAIPPPSTTSDRDLEPAAHEAPQFSQREDPVATQRSEIAEMASELAGHLANGDWDEALSSITLPFALSLWAPASEPPFVDYTECDIDSESLRHFHFWRCDLEDPSRIREALADLAPDFAEALQYVHAQSESIRPTATSARFIMDPFVLSFAREEDQWRLTRCCGGRIWEF